MRRSLHMSRRPGRWIGKCKNTPSESLSFYGGVFKAEITSHYRGDPLKPKNQHRMTSEAPIWPKIGRIHLPPLMFWACPEGTTASDGQKQKGTLAAILKSCQRAPTSPPPIFRCGKCVKILKASLKCLGTSSEK